MFRFFKLKSFHSQRVLFAQASKVTAIGAWASGVFALSTLQAQEAFCESVDFDKVRADIESILDKEGYDDGSLGPLFVRLAWHASGTYSVVSKDGGSNGGRIRFSPEKDWGANAGLQIALKALEPIKKKYPGLSFADLITLSGVVAIEAMGGPKIEWKSGRVDFPDGKTSPADGRLPDASKKVPHLRDIFYRMGFTDRDIVALSGAHSLGRCHVDRSGFSGPWTFAPTTVSNEYFKLLLSEKWEVKKWSGPLQYEDQKTRELMMLPSDLALLEDPLTRKYVQLYARDEEAWRSDFAASFSKLLNLGL